MLAAYRKTVASVVGTFLTWAGVAYVPDGHIDRVEWFALAVAVATNFGVYAVTNSPRPAPVELLPEPSSVKFLAPVPAPVTPAVPLTLVPDSTVALPGHITPA